MQTETAKGKETSEAIETAKRNIVERSSDDADMLKFIYVARLKNTQFAVIT